MIWRSAEKIYRFLDQRPLLVLAFATLWLLIEFVGLGPHSYIDSYSLVHYASIPLALDGGGGYWFPFGIGGLDLKSIQFVFPLANFLYGALPGFIAYQIVVITCVGSASFFTYLLLRVRLSLSPAASTIGAISFALYVVGHFSGHVVDYSILPALIWALGYLRVLSFWRASVFVVLLALAVSSVSTIVFAVPFVPIGVLIWYTVIEFETRIRVWLFGIAFFVLYGVTKIPDVWALLLHLPLSSRTVIPEMNHDPGQAFDDALNIARLAVSPESHIGLVFPLMVAAIIIFKIRDRLTVSVALVVPVTIVLLAGTYFLFRSVPLLRETGLSTFSFARISWTVAFFLSIGLGLACSGLLSWVGRKDARWPAMLTAAAFVVLFAYSLVPKIVKMPVWYYRGGYAALYHKDDIRQFARTIEAESDPYRMAAYHLYDARFQAYGMETLGGWYSVYPKRWRQYVMELNGFEDDNIKFYNNKEAIFSSKINHSLLSLANVKFLVTYLPMDMSELELLDEPDAVTSTLDVREKLLFFLKFNFGDAHKFYFYRNPDAFPRFFLTEQVRLFDDRHGLLDALGAASEGELRRTAFVEWPVTRTGKPPSSKTANGQVRLVAGHADRISLEVSAEDRTFLVAANNYSPYWKARIDGELTPIYPADHTFWGVEVGPGDHRLEFTYEPPYAKVWFLDLSWWWSRVLSRSPS